MGMTVYNDNKALLPFIHLQQQGHAFQISTNGSQMFCLHLHMQDLISELHHPLQKQQRMEMWILGSQIMDQSQVQATAIVTHCHTHLNQDTLEIPLHRPMLLVNALLSTEPTSR